MEYLPKLLEILKAVMANPAMSELEKFALKEAQAEIEKLLGK